MAKLVSLTKYTVEIFCEDDLDDDEIEALSEASPDDWALLERIEGLVRLMGNATEERPRLTLRVCNSANVQPEIKVVE